MIEPGTALSVDGLLQSSEPHPRSFLDRIAANCRWHVHGERKKPAKIGFAGLSFKRQPTVPAALVRRRQGPRTLLGIGFAASLIQHRTRPCRREPSLDGFDTLAGGA